MAEGKKGPVCFVLTWAGSGGEKAYRPDKRRALAFRRRGGDSDYPLLLRHSALEKRKTLSTPSSVFSFQRRETVDATLSQASDELFCSFPFILSPVFPLPLDAALSLPPSSPSPTLLPPEFLNPLRPLFSSPLSLLSICRNVSRGSRRRRHEESKVRRRLRPLCRYLPSQKGGGGGGGGGGGRWGRLPFPYCHPEDVSRWNLLFWQTFAKTERIHCRLRQ